jgi:hypothetical protein
MLVDAGKEVRRKSLTDRKSGLDGATLFWPQCLPFSVTVHSIASSFQCSLRPNARSLAQLVTADEVTHTRDKLIGEMCD